MEVDSVGDPWSPEEAVRAVADASHIHVGALLRTDFSSETLEALRARASHILIDAQGIVRRAEPGPLAKDSAIGDVLRHITILKLNEGEATALAGGTDAAALRALGVPEIVLTLGSRGSLVVTATTDDVVAATPVATVDPTGAGDAFAAAYLWFRSEEIPPAEAAARASRFVAIVLAERT